MGSGLDALIDRFFEAHTTEDEDARRRLLDAAITDDAIFHGLQVELEGKEAIAERFRGESSLVRTGPVVVTGAWLSWPWEYRRPDGDIEESESGAPYAGVAFAQTGKDGLLRLVVPVLRGPA